MVGVQEVSTKENIWDVALGAPKLVIPKAYMPLSFKLVQKYVEGSKHCNVVGFWNRRFGHDRGTQIVDKTHL